MIAGPGPGWEDGGIDLERVGSIVALAANVTLAVNSSRTRFVDWIGIAFWYLAYK